ncbi:uncharacterized protein LOC6731345 [Drosophila simulans]|uniref:Uncharacterized protein n=1 Tax=Drosophila simulans TaxID=7240 RepID=A0A0J9THU0_DROSI|nr:uncharacterized protein LOC6731345 [Drosophila simulans]KMY88755.1 uncharacterized protein Dsimw501_GD23467 [Drosophila simulans]
MFKSIRIFLCALMVLELLGFPTGAQSNTCPLSDPSSQCSAFCVSALQPVIDHLRKDLEDWGSCDVKLNETQEKLQRIELATNEILSGTQLIFHFSNLTHTVSEDLAERLDRIEGNQAVLGNQLQAIMNSTEVKLTAMRNTLSKLECRSMLQSYRENEGQRKRSSYLP